MHVNIIFGLKHVIIQELDFFLIVWEAKHNPFVLNIAIFDRYSTYFLPSVKPQAPKIFYFFLQFMKKYNMSLAPSQKLQIASLFIVIEQSHLLQGIILWIILNWNHWIFVVSLVVQKGRLKTIFQTLSLTVSRSGNSFIQAFLHFGIMLILFNFESYTDQTFCIVYLWVKKSPLSMYIYY